MSYTLYVASLDLLDGSEPQDVYTVRPDTEPASCNVVKSGFDTWEQAWDWYHVNIEPRLQPTATSTAIVVHVQDDAVARGYDR